MPDLFGPPTIQRLIFTITAVVIGLVVLVCACVLLVMFFHTRAEYGQRVARRQTLLGVVIFVALSAFISSIIYLGVQFVDSTPWISIINLVLSLAIWILLPISFIRHRRAGAILLDLGSVSFHRLWFILGGLWFLMAVGTVFTKILDQGFTIESTSELLVRLSIAGISIANGFGRVQIRERGILQGALLAWDKIQSYGWERDKPSTLTLHLRSKFSWLREVNIAVPAELREQVEALLAQHVQPVAPSTPPSVVSSS